MTLRTGDLVWPSTSPSKWRGRWIAPPGVASLDIAYFYARKRFLSSDTSRCCSLLHIAAETLYLLYVNGIEIGHGPVRGTHTVNFFDTFDISPHLRRGENWLAVAVHCPNAASFKHSPAQPGVFAQSHDGSIVTDETWQVQISPAHRADAPIYTYQIGRMEWKDDRAEPVGWETGKDDGQWSPATVLGPDERLGGKTLLARDIPALSIERFPPTDIPIMATTPPLDNVMDPSVALRMTHETHKPLAIPIDVSALLGTGQHPIAIPPAPLGAGVAIIFDFGREINGGLEIDIDAPSGTVVDIGYQEELRDGRLDVAIGDYAFADRYILRDGLQCVGNEFAERGFRLAQVVLRNFNQPIHFHRVAAVNRLYPYDKSGSFTSSDRVLNRLWATCAETVRVCSTDTFVDCPWRENAFWLNDLIVEALSSLQLFGDPIIVKRCVRLAASQVRPDGLFPATVPYGQAPDMTLQASMDRMTLTAGNLTFPQVLEDYLLYTGDQSTVAELAELMIPMLARFASWEDNSGFCHPPIQFWNFIDWSYPVSIENHVTCALEWFRVLALDTTARLLKRLDPDRNTCQLTDQSNRLTAAINNRFWDNDEQCYLEGVNDPAGLPLITQLTQSLAILSGRLTHQRRSALSESLLRDDLLAPELFMHHFVLRALVATNRSSTALDRIRRYWFPMIESGSPTIWELGVHTIGKAGFEGAGSLCHGFSTTPIDFMQGVVLGIRPTAPGFTRCSFTPHSVGLKHAKGQISTPSGVLHVAWHRSQSVIEATLIVPPNTTVDLTNGKSLSQGAHRLTLATAHITPTTKKRLAVAAEATTSDRKARLVLPPS